jgi:hypothetical protein
MACATASSGVRSRTWGGAEALCRTQTGSGLPNDYIAIVRMRITKADCPSWETQKAHVSTQFRVLLSTATAM